MAYHIVRNFGDKKLWRNSDFETLATKKLWRIQGLPAFLVHDSSELRKLQKYRAYASSSVQDYC